MKCISDIFTEKGLLEEKSGVLINKKNIFNIDSDADSSLKRVYLNFASRVGVEIAGIQCPVSGINPLISIKFEIIKEYDNDKFKIKLENNIIKIKASSINNLEKANEYMTCMFPYLNEHVMLNDIKQFISEQYNCEVNIIEINLYLQTFEMESIEFAAGNNQKIKKDKQYFLSCLQENKKTCGEEKTYPKIKQYFNQSFNYNMVVNNSYLGNIEDLLLLSLRTYIDNFEVSYPICSDKPVNGKNNLVFEYKSDEKESIKLNDDNIVFTFEAPDSNTLINNYIYKYDELKDLNKSDLLLTIKDILNSKNDIGQIIELLSMKNCSLAKVEVILKDYSHAVLDENRLNEYLSNKFAGNIKLKKYNDEKEIFNISEKFKWEGNEFTANFIKEAEAKISDGDEIEVSGVLSEDYDVRQDLENQIRKVVREHGGTCTTVKIYRSLKSGLSWIEETVLPDIISRVKTDDIDKIIIKFKYFTNGLNEEAFESESTPNYGVHLDKPDKWFDIPIRWLQELFPVDEIIENKLNISKDDVIFEKTDEGDNTYSIEVLDKSFNVIYTNNYDVKYVQKYYMSKYPSIGRTHVTTGWINVKNNGETILDKRVVTDTENIWEFMEGQVLPKLEKYLVNKYGTENLPDMQPLFNKLQINIKMSEVDYDLGIREERISTTESMQEDIYFYILDWFKTFGERECGKALDNIGLIMPEIINCKKEDSSIEVILYDDYSDDAYIISNEGPKRIIEGNVEFKPQEISFKDSYIHLYIDVTCGHHQNIFNKLNVLQELIDNKIINFSNRDNYLLTFKAGDLEKTVVLEAYKYSDNIITESEKQHTVDNEIISYVKYMDILNYYRKYDELSIKPVETTYKGRKIYCIEIIKKDSDVIYSDNKLMTNRITCIYNARHHGNEASGMNSAFMMLDKLLKDENYKEKLNKLNVILLPYENIDGGEIHCSMHKDNPKWLSHVARYNSAGYEFRKDYSNSDSIYGEAKALVKLWKKWLPDIVTDNHGFEGHELYMPFSGYISPWYKSFWIPRALYYGYIWYDKRFPHMKAYGEKIQDSVADAINADKEIKALNKCFSERFYKYAEKWFPEMFNTEKHKDVIFYWIETTKKKRDCNFSLEFPEITTMDWTTEVADETAAGDYLKLNAKAHLISDMALLGLMYDTEIVFETYIQKHDDGVIYSKMRRRPI